MDALKSLLELLKCYAYELVALVLPGAMLVAAANDTTGFQPIGGAVGLVVAAYAIGVAVQGASSLIVHKFWKNSADPNAEVVALALAEAETDLGRAVPESALLDFCLSRVGADRNVYDKFTALRDTARALGSSAPVAAALATYGHWAGIWTGSTLAGLARISSVVIGTLLFSFACFSRYQRFSPLAKNAMFGQYLALRAVEKRAAVSKT